MLASDGQLPFSSDHKMGSWIAKSGADCRGGTPWPPHELVSTLRTRPAWIANFTPTFCSEPKWGGHGVYSARLITSL